jgi:hypothetical protein
MIFQYNIKITESKAVASTNIRIANESNKVADFSKINTSTNRVIELPDIVSFKKQMDDFTQPSDAINYIRQNTPPMYLPISYYKAILHFSNNDPATVKYLYTLLPNGQTKSLVAEKIVCKLAELEDVSAIDEWINSLETKREQRHARNSLNALINNNPFPP